MKAGIKPPWTIHYTEGDVLLCQPVGAIGMRVIDKGGKDRLIGLEETSTSTLIQTRATRLMRDLEDQWRTV